MYEIRAAEMNKIDRRVRVIFMQIYDIVIFVWCYFLHGGDVVYIHTSIVQRLMLCSVRADEKYLIGTKNYPSFEKITRPSRRFDYGAGTEQGRTFYILLGNFSTHKNEDFENVFMKMLAIGKQMALK